jgi:pimeloyl-ACP methyl ester carboxylesterase
MRFARLERPLLVAGLALITVHLLDLALAGPDTALLGVLAIVAVPAAALWAQPHVTRATRFALAATVGALFAGFGIASAGLHAALQGPALYDLTGLGAIAGGLLLVAGGVAALTAPGRRDRQHRALHVLLWLVGAYVALSFVLLPLAFSLLITHAPRNPVAALAIPHRDVRIGGSLAAAYVPSRNGAAVLLIHGSSGNRARVADRARLLARHGYGVLAIDLPGNGESDGRSNGLGDNAQPAVTAALDYLEPRVDRIAGFGVSLGGEVLLEAAARDARLRAVISDGAARPEDAGMPLQTRIVRTMVRGLSGMQPAPPLDGAMPHSPLLLIASGAPEEIPVNRRYAANAGPRAQLWEIPEGGHTGGLRARPAEYERRVTEFLDEAL